MFRDYEQNTFIYMFLIENIEKFIFKKSVVREYPKKTSIFVANSRLLGKFRECTAIILITHYGASDENKCMVIAAWSLCGKSTRMSLLLKHA